MRIGHGYDAHRFCEGRPLVLGGVQIPHPQGLAAHSDGDAVCHALCDALLGAAALGDLGSHFPDCDPAYAGMSSLRFVERVVELLQERSLRLVHADVTILAEVPRLAPYMQAMRETLAQTLGIDAGGIGIKATTTEGMGAIGRREGIAVHAVVLLDQVLER